MRDVEMEPADFRKQPVWRQAFRLTIDVYRLMGAFPSLERWDGLATLMRKSVSSMGAHIAEGCTHLGCPVLYRRESKQIECPCHQGFFSAEDGKVIAGPPPRPLPRVELERKGDELWATAIRK